MTSSPIISSSKSDLLERSFAHCEHVAKTQAKNFYYSFLTLTPERKAAMCAIYAFMRYSDDVSDEAAEDKTKADQMRQWRAALDRAFAGDYGDSLILPAFHETVLRYHIPASLLPRLDRRHGNGFNQDALRNVGRTAPVLLPRGKHRRFRLYPRLGLR